MLASELLTVSVTPSAAVLSFSGVIVAGALTYFGARFTATAQLQKTLLDASRSFVRERQEEITRLNVLITAKDALISERDRRIVELEGEILRQRGTINQGLAREEALQRRLNKRDAPKL